MRKTLRASVLALALVCPTFAGEIHNPVAQPTPAPAQETTVEGDISTPLAGGVIHNPEEASAIRAVMSLIESLLALL